MAFALTGKRSSIFLVVAAISGSAIAFVFGVFVGNTLPGPNIFFTRHVIFMGDRCCHSYDNCTDLHSCG